MTAESVSRKLDPWKVTLQVLSEAKRVGDLIRERDEKIKESTAACPIHPNRRGKYSHLTGNFTRVRPVYVCPKGQHQFTLQD